MDDIDWQLLLELAVTLGESAAGDQESQDLNLAYLARRLGCRAIGILRFGDREEASTWLVSPQDAVTSPDWEGIVAVVGRMDTRGLGRFVVEENDDTLHVFDLPGFGALVLIRCDPLPEPFLSSFEPVVGLLGHMAKAQFYQKQAAALDQMTADLELELGSLADALPFPAWFCETSGIILNFNKAFLRWTTGNSEAIRGKLPEEVLNKTLAEVVAAGTGEVLASSQGQVREARTAGDNVYQFHFVPENDIAGQPRGVLGFAFDVSKATRAIDELRDATEFSRLISELAATLVAVPIQHIDETIDDALRAAGRFTGADRVYVFHYDFDANTATNTHEWVAAGIEPQIDQLQEVSMDPFTDWLERHLNGEIMLIPSVADLAPESATRQVLEAQGIQTLAAVPIMNDGRAIGFVGFDSVRDEREWSQRELELLELLAILLNQANERVEHARQTYAAQLSADTAAASLGLALSATGGGAWDWDARTLQTTFSAELMAILKFPRHTKVVDSQNLPEWTAPANYQAILAETKRVLEGDEDRFVLDTAVFDAQGQLVPVRLRGAILRVEGRIVRLAGTLEDLSSIRSEESYQYRRSAVRDLIAHQPSQLLLPGEFDQAVQYMLAALGQIMDASRVSIIWIQEDLAKRTVYDWCAEGIPVENEPSVPLDDLAIPMRTLQDGKNVVIEDIDALPDDRARERNAYRRAGIRSLMTLPMFVSGELAGVIGFDHTERTSAWTMNDAAMLRDASELLAAAFTRRQAEDTLREAKAAAERSDQSKTEFLSLISHELRTPITGVIGMMELAKADARRDEQRQRISTAIGSANSLLRLLDDLIDTTQIADGKFVIHSEPVDVRRLLVEVADLASTFQGAQGLDVQLVIDPKLPEYLELDGARFRQIVINLVTNALKYTDTGWVRICAGHAVTDDGERLLELVIEDTGIGIADEDRDRVMEPFLRLEAAVRQDLDGTGLGLTIVHRLVKMHGGSISLSDREGPGTRAIVHLPMHEVAAPSVASRMHRVELAGKRVLVAEDNGVHREVIAAYLAELGCTAKIVDDGAQALLCIDDELFDVVMLDCYMPEVRGPSAAEIIRSRGDVRGRVPLIAVTADVSQANLLKCHAAGIDAVLTKPFDREQLSAVLQRVLSGPSKWLSGSSTEAGQAWSLESSVRLDREVVDALTSPRRSDDDLFARLLQHFSEDARSLVDQIAEGTAMGDLDQARVAAHTLQSSAATLGLKRLEQLCRSFQDQAASALAGNTAMLAPLSHAINEEFGHSLQALLDVRLGPEVMGKR